MTNIDVQLPTEFIIARGNAFWLGSGVQAGTVFAAPVLAKWGPTEVEWTEAVEVERDDDNQHFFDAIYRALDVITT